MATGGRRRLGFLLRENAEVNKCRRIKCKYRRQTPKDPCFFHWRSLFSLLPFLAPEWILHPARPAHNRLLPLRMPPALSPLERGPCKTIRFVMKRNKVLQVKKSMIKRQMLGDFQNSDRKSTRLNSSHRCISYA